MDFTLNEIAANLNRSKTTIYFHIKGIPLSEEKLNVIRSEASKRAFEQSQKRKGVSFLNRHPFPFSQWTKTTVFLVSHLIFDGEIKRSGCIYTNRSMALIGRVKSAMKTVYPFSFKLYESIPGVHKICFYNVELANYLKSKKEELLKGITHLDKKLQRVFLQSFFDDEGSVYFIGKRRAVRGYQHSEEVLNIIHILLNNFGIGSRIDYRYNEIVVSGAENLIAFHKNINFSKGIHINGNRSNSIWKQSLEKRKILEMAINSYR